MRIKKVFLNRQGAKRFKLRGLPNGMNRVRILMSTNQAGAGYIFGTSQHAQLPPPIARLEIVERPRRGPAASQLFAAPRWGFAVSAGGDAAGSPRRSPFGIA